MRLFELSERVNIDILPQMSGPVYSFVRLFLATLYPAYYSFKAVKNKNVKEWVFWELLIIELSIIRQLQVCQGDDVLDHLRILYCIWISHGSIPYFLVRKNKGTMKEEKEVNVFSRLPFYSEVKMVLLLYLVAPATRGSGVIYRRWPFSCSS